MLLKGKKLKQDQNVLARKAKHLLARNFFAINDFKKMSKRKALKVLKLISQIENKSVKKAELISLYEFIISEMQVKKVTKFVVQYFDFALSLFDNATTSISETINSLCAAFNFRLIMKKVFRI